MPRSAVALAVFLFVIAVEIPLTVLILQLLEG